MKNKTFNSSLKILLMTNAFILLAGAMLGPIYALFVKEIGGDLLDASIAGAVFAFAAGITVVVSGKFGDSVKENKFILLLGYFLMGLGFLLYMFVESLIVLLLVQVIIGLGEAVYAPIFDALYSKHLDRGKYATEWGVWESMDYFTSAFGAIAGGFFVTYFGFKAMFFLMALLCFSSCIYIWLVRKQL